MPQFVSFPLFRDPKMTNCELTRSTFHSAQPIQSRIKTSKLHQSAYNDPNSAQSSKILATIHKTDLVLQLNQRKDSRSCRSPTTGRNGLLLGLVSPPPPPRPLPPLLLLLLLLLLRPLPQPSSQTPPSQPVRPPLASPTLCENCAESRRRWRKPAFVE